MGSLGADLLYGQAVGSLSYIFGVVLIKGAIKNMASKDFEDLMDLLFKKKQRIEKITTSLNGSGTGHAHISFIGAIDMFSSKEPDVVQYTLHLKHTIDSDGNYELGAFKDIEQYYRDVDFLLDAEKSKLDQAYRDLVDARYIFDFNSDELIEEFLLSHNRKSKKFSKLKSEHFYIAAYCMNEAAHALQQYEQMKSKIPGFESYHHAIEKVYMKAFRSDPNFVKNYIQQKTTNDFNLVNFMAQVRAIIQHVDLMKTIYPKDGMQADQGIHLLLDSYRRCAEACVKPLDLLRIGQEIADGDPCPKRTKSAEENKAILQPTLGAILDCYDPRIRNSESHLSTEVDAKNGQVLFYKDAKGRRELLVKYSFVELANMTNKLQHILFPALVVTAYMEWRTMLLVITLRSHEYKLALLKIGN